jgi:hypothetical protein
VYLLSCTNNDITGNGTQIGNPTIAGIIYEPGGKTPAQNATVYLRKKNSLINIGLKKQNTDIAIVSTNEKGVFVIDSVESGTYVIECSDQNKNFALYDSVVVANSDSSILLPIDTLKPAGVITGTVRLPEGGDLGRVYVLVFGVQRFSIVSSNGNFCLSDLAEGNYNIRFISGLENYGVLDTNMITVVSGDTTFLDTIELPYTGTPLIKNLAITYDTLTNKTTLSWNKIDTSLIMGFNLYRKLNCKDPELLDLNYRSENDSCGIFKKINKTLLTEPVFHDSTTAQNQTYAYRVSVIRKDTTESVKSPETSVHIATYFETDTIFSYNSIELAGKRYNPNKIIYTNGLFYTVVTGTGIQISDSNFNPIGILGTAPLGSGEIAADAHGRIYLSSVNNYHNIMKIFIYNQNGTVEKRLNLNDTLDTIPAIGIEASLFRVSKNGHIIFVSSKKDSIYVCDSSGVIIKKWGGFGDGTGNNGITAMTTDINNNIYLYEFEKDINIYDSNGVFLRKINNGLYYVNSMAVDPENGNIYTCPGGIQVLSPGGQLITTCRSSPYTIMNLLLSGGKIYAMGGNYNFGIVLKITNNLP